MIDSGLILGVCFDQLLEEAEALCNRIAMLKRGSIIALDTPQALIDRAGVEDLEEAFVKIMNAKELIAEAA